VVVHFNNANVFIHHVQVKKSVAVVKQDSHTVACIVRAFCWRFLNHGKFESLNITYVDVIQSITYEWG
jgi:hypothetical protein